MKRKLSVLFWLFILLSAFPCRISAVSTSAAAAILMDAKSGEVLYEKNADTMKLVTHEDLRGDNYTLFNPFSAYGKDNKTGLYSLYFEKLTTLSENPRAALSFDEEFERFGFDKDSLPKFDFMFSKNLSHCIFHNMTATIFASICVQSRFDSKDIIDKVFDCAFSEQISQSCAFQKFNNSVN